MTQVHTAPAPTTEQARIESLDVLRGFALLGILLLNIIGFGLVSSAYQNPMAGFTVSADIAVWAGIELFAEGAMRTLFSMLFGAGVVLFVGDLGKGISLHMRRNFVAAYMSDISTMRMEAVITRRLALTLRTVYNSAPANA